MLVGGYRVTTPVAAGFIRRVADVSPLAPTVIFSVGLRVLIPLLLAGFAYRQRRDPLIFHSVALGSASLLPTPPFGGYLDNVLTLAFLAASLYLFVPARTSWPARIGLVFMLLVAAMTHPTAYAIFGIVVGLVAAVHLVARRFDLASVIRDDGPGLAAVVVSAVVMYAVWKIGIWGQPAALSEAAVPPPADSDFFFTRLGGWVRALRPTFNAPLILIGIIGLLAAGKRAFDDVLTNFSILWLLPLAGTLGFVAGIAYPYYRFLNHTLAWVLLAGLGIYFLLRFLVGAIARGGAGLLALIGVAAIAWVITTNFTTGFEQVGWNDVEQAWIKPDQLKEMNALRASLAGQTERPVVFVADDETTEAVRVYGFTKLVANVSRYGVALGQQDRSYVYLGSLESFLADEPTQRDDDFYTELSEDTLDDARAGIERAGVEPIVVVASVFNETGSNAGILPGDLGHSALDLGGAELRLIDADGGFTKVAESGAESSLSSFFTPAQDPGWLHVLRVLGGLLILLVPGFFAVRWMLPDSGVAEGLALVPTVAVALHSFAGIAVLAVLRSPLTGAVAWATTLALSALTAVALAARAGAQRRAGA
jgi:hypothetical protein